MVADSATTRIACGQGATPAFDYAAALLFILLCANDSYSSLRRLLTTPTHRALSVFASVCSRSARPSVRALCWRAVPAGARGDSEGTWRHLPYDPLGVKVIAALGFLFAFLVQTVAHFWDYGSGVCPPVGYSLRCLFFSGFTLCGLHCFASALFRCSFSRCWSTLLATLLRTPL